MRGVTTKRTISYHDRAAVIEDGTSQRAPTATDEKVPGAGKGPTIASYAIAVGS